MRKALMLVEGDAMPSPVGDGGCATSASSAAAAAGAAAAVVAMAVVVAAAMVGSGRTGELSVVSSSIAISDELSPMPHTRASAVSQMSERTKEDRQPATSESMHPEFGAGVHSAQNMYAAVHS